jgi:hypothetical protein
VSPCRALNEARALAGWSAEETIDVLLGYVYAQQSDDAFKDYVLSAAREDEADKDD